MTNYENKTKEEKQKANQIIIYKNKNEIYEKKYIVIYIHTHTIYTNILNGYAEDIQKQQQQQQPQDTKTMWKCVFIMKIGKTTKTYEK